MTMEDIHQSANGRCNWDLEGSRFIVRRLCNAAASGSRERPRMMQVYRAAVSTSLEQSHWANIYAGLFPGAACCQPIELPHYKAAPLQALGNRRRVLRSTKRT
jgi:hypothetical protein